MQPRVETHAGYGQSDSTSVLRLWGQVRHPQARALRHLVDDVVLKSPGDTVFVDLRGVELIDSTGMGLLARIGRATAERHGRRAVLICPASDVATCLKSAAFDQLFLMVDDFPFDPEVEVREVTLEAAAPVDIGQVVLDAHRELAQASPENQRVFGELVALLEAETQKPKV